MKTAVDRVGRGKARAVNDRFSAMLEELIQSVGELNVSP
jgi:hypothetical protein